jgi:uroporphyrinogen-III synthase
VKSGRRGSSPSGALPLDGLRVLVGRARHQASALSAELRKLGARVVEIPFIEIRKPRSFAQLDTALHNLHNYDWLILTSVNGVEAMWERMEKLRRKGTATGDNSDFHLAQVREGHDFSRATKRKNSKSAFAAEGLLVAAIGPATKKAIEQRGLKVDVVPKEYVAESVVRSLRRRVKGKRVLLVRAKVARDVIPRELRKAGAQVDVVEAYETVVPQSSRVRLRAALKDANNCPDVITFTSSSTVRNFVSLLGGPRPASRTLHAGDRRGRLYRRVYLASIGPVTSSTLRETGLHPDVEAKKYTIPGLVEAIVQLYKSRPSS